MDEIDADVFQFPATEESDSEHLSMLGGPDMLDMEFPGQDINDNENIEDLINQIVGETGASSFPETNIINSNSQDLTQKSDVEASQDHPSLPKKSEGSEVAGKLSKSARKAQKEREQIYQRRKMEKIRKNIDKLKKRAEENIGKKYLGFGETKPPSESKKKEKKLKTLKRANVSDEEKNLIQQLMEYSESSVNSEVSN